jgi:LysM repeat protein
MKNYTRSRYWLISFTLLLVTLVSAGCWRSTNDDDLGSTPVARALPTETATPSPSPEPSETPTETPTLNPAEITAEAFSAQVLEPEVVITEVFVTEIAITEVAQVDPFFLTATQLIAEATATAFTLTETANAPFNVIVETPVPTLEPTIAPTAPVNDGGFGGGTAPVMGADCVHQVVAGENMFRLSLRYGVSIMDIANRSGVTNPNMIVVGQRLTIPGCGTTGVFPPPTSVSPDGTGGTGGIGGTGGTGSGGGRIHVVRQYETLFQISMQYNVPIMTIASANGISNTNLIYFGQELTIP